MKFPIPSLVVVLAMAVSYASCEQPSSAPPPQPDPVSVISNVPLTPPPQPTPAPPTVEPAVEPTTVQIVEPLPFAIEGPIFIESGRMLTLTISGVTTTATTSGPVPGISWAMYPQSDEARIERNGYAIHYTSPTPCHVWFVASVNNPDPTGKPFTAMKLVTVGQPPVVVPPVVPPGPKPPVPPPVPVTTGSKRIVVIRESLEPSPEMGRLIVLMQSGPIGDYMKSKGHEFESFDKDAKDENGQPSAYVKKWLDAVGAVKIPTAVIVDIATGTISHVQSLGEKPTAQALLDIAKEHGG